MMEKSLARRKRDRSHRPQRMTAPVLAAVSTVLLVFLGSAVCLSQTDQPTSEEGTPLPTPGQTQTEPPAGAVSSVRTDTDDAAWNLRLVNRWNPLPGGYEAALKEVPGGETVDERIYEPLMEMLEAAKEENWGEAPRVISGYRTQEDQEALYAYEVDQYRSKGYSKDDAEEEAGKWVAVPGTSEHQLGLAVDIEGNTYDVFLWLQENSYKYGFIFRYPGDKTELTGTAEEVWHYRYVGKEAAAEIYEGGLCLEEFVGTQPPL